LASAGREKAENERERKRTETTVVHSQAEGGNNSPAGKNSAARPRFLAIAARSGNNFPVSEGTGLEAGLLPTIAVELEEAGTELNQVCTVLVVKVEVTLVFS
jgi:hypothetical protein